MFFYCARKVRGKLLGGLAMAGKPARLLFLSRGGSNFFFFLEDTRPPAGYSPFLPKKATRDDGQRRLMPDEPSSLLIDGVGREARAWRRGLLSSRRGRHSLSTPGAARRGAALRRDETSFRHFERHNAPTTKELMVLADSKRFTGAAAPYPLSWAAWALCR